MKKQLFTSLLLLLFSSVSVFSQQILSVTQSGQPPYNDMGALIRDHFTGAGVEILGVESGNDPQAIGYFTDGDSSIGLNRGLILASGYAGDASNNGNEHASNWIAGDSSLSQLEAIATGLIYDVAYFRITFRPFSDFIRFRYVFASEEYPEYACTNFNDVFGFFLSGPSPAGGTYVDQNIALIPGTNLPVSINNLHPYNQAAQACPPFNAQFYHDNNGSNNQPVYDGFTDVFVAEAAVIPCATYVMLIAIADVGDSAYDSAVFLEAKSLESDVEVISSLETGDAFIPEIAIADTISFTFAEIPVELLPLRIKILGTATNGIDFQSVDSITFVNSSGEIVHFVIQPIQDSLQEELETVIFNVCGAAANNCFSQTFTLYIADPDSLYSPSDTVVLLANSSTLLSANPTSISNQSWTFSNNTSYTIAPTLTLISSEIMVDIPFDMLHDLQMLELVCLNINHAFDADLNIFVIAPNGTFVELSTDNGGSGDHYTNTCFSPAATADIRGEFPFAPASFAPFTGLFQPEGSWDDIIDTPVNGAWKLGVLDEQAGLTGTLLNWAITFSTYNLGNFKYLWNTGDTTPSLLVNAAGNYSITVSNNVGSFSKMFVVNEGSVGTQTIGEVPVFQIFPNPSGGEATLILNPNVDIFALKVYDLNGSLVLEQQSAGPINGFRDLSNGVYIVTLECDKGVFAQKLVRW